MENRRRNLVDRVKRNIKKGYTLESLKWAMVGQGYSKAEVNGILEIAEREIKEESPKPKEKKEKPKIKHELYDVDNKPIKITTRKPKEGFFSKFFS